MWIEGASEDTCRYLRDSVINGLSRHGLSLLGDPQPFRSLAPEKIRPDVVDVVGEGNSEAIRNRQLQGDVCFGLFGVEDQR
jgi:hypothetical protein